MQDGRVIVLMGVSGSGKTTVGRLLAGELGWPFHDGDDLHPPANVEKMSRGLPLTDEDRAPWLAAIAQLVDGILAEGRSAVVACSALRQAYRTQLVRDPQRVRLVHLHGSAELLRQRLEQRGGHFFRPELLPSQLQTLEPPDDALEIDVAAPPEQLVQRIRHKLGL